MVLFASGTATFINGSAILLNTHPKNKLLNYFRYLCFRKL